MLIPRRRRHTTAELGSVLHVCAQNSSKRDTEDAHYHIYGLPPAAKEEESFSQSQSLNSAGLGPSVFLFRVELLASVFACHTGFRCGRGPFSELLLKIDTDGSAHACTGVEMRGGSESSWDGFLPSFFFFFSICT